MSDLIRRSDAIDAIECVTWYHQNRNKDMVSGANSDEHQAWYKSQDIYKALENVPSADRPQGEWIVKDGAFYCSCCGNDSAGLSEDDVYVYDVPLPNYCQHCGAHMKGADDE